MKKNFRNLLAAGLAFAIVMTTGLTAPTSVNAGDLIKGDNEEKTASEINFTDRVHYANSLFREKADVAVTDADFLYTLVCVGYNEFQGGISDAGLGKGPFSITEGYAYINGEKETIYFVLLSGTDPNLPKQNTYFDTDLRSGFEMDNAYVDDVVAQITDRIKEKDARLIIAGHSLGGMVAQQVAAKQEIKDYYNIMNVVCFGSPLIKGFERDGLVKRLGDTSDPVPYMSVSTFTNIIWQDWGLNKEDGEYGGYTNALAAHTQSYAKHDIWGSYDAVGIKGGSNSFVLKLSTTKFYPTDKDKDKDKDKNN